MKKLKYPKAFAHLSEKELKAMPVKVITIVSGMMCGECYVDLSDAASYHKELLTRYAGPFADSLNGRHCIRFESPEVCEMLSE